MRLLDDHEMATMSINGHDVIDECDDPDVDPHAEHEVDWEYVAKPRVRKPPAASQPTPVQQVESIMDAVVDTNEGVARSIDAAMAARDSSDEGDVDGEVEDNVTSSSDESSVEQPVVEQPLDQPVHPGPSHVPAPVSEFPEPSLATLAHCVETLNHVHSVAAISGLFFPHIVVTRRWLDYDKLQHIADIGQILQFGGTTLQVTCRRHQSCRLAIDYCNKYYACEAMCLKWLLAGLEVDAERHTDLMEDVESKFIAYRIR